MRRICGSLGLLLLLGVPGFASAARVEGLRLRQDADHTRLVFDLSAQARYRISTAENPARLIIDVEQSRLQGSLQGVELAGTPIRQIRTGMFTPSDLRIVLDLHTAVKPESFQLPAGDGHGGRIVVDLVAKGSFPAAPVLAANRTAPEPARTPESSPAVGRAGPGADQSTASALPLPSPGVQGASVASLPPAVPATAGSDGGTAVPTTPAAPVMKNEAPAARTEAPAATIEEPARIVVPQTPARAILVAIDAGHGGQDPGALGPRRVREKDVVLAIAKALEKRVNAQPGYRATMVRSSDVFVPLDKRRDIARATGADLFVSIHADAFRHSRARGGSVYALSQRGATSASAALLARRENGADLIGGVGLGQKDKVLAGVLTDLSMTATLESSLGVGSRVLGSMGKLTRLHARHVEQAGFIVLKSPDMPSILVETGFISNPAEAEKLSTPKYQQAMAGVIFEGLGDYFLANPPSGTQVAHAVANGAHPAEYVIAHGDTLSGIAERYRVSVASLVRTNGLGDAGGIQAGQRILIPKS